MVVASFSQWGEKCLNLNGMWALGIWDHKRKRLFLSRDRFGKKPLFYAFVKNEYGMQFIFASEMKAIYPYLKELKPSKDFAYMTNIHNIFSYENGGGALISGIKRFPHSHFAYYDFSKHTSSDAPTLQFIRYYNILDHLVSAPKHNDAIEYFKELFLDAVHLRMRSDVPIGTALSGGLDSSSTICAMAHIAKQTPDKYTNDWQHAFVACFKDTPLNESKYARAVVDYIGIVV